MTDTSATAINARTPEEELQALVALLAGLSQMSLAMAKHCLDLQTRLPGVINAAIAAQVAPISPILAWVPMVPRTPDELEAAHPCPPEGSIERAYHVVTTGREPGLYDNVEQSDYQVLGVPNGKRRKVTGLAAALAYYRAKYAAQEVAKWGPQPSGDAAPPPPTAETAPAASTSAVYSHSQQVTVSVRIG
ncbi:hypothetical protein C8F04DRAFT_1194943 [Mycena alexandri]|uniref:Uncharacterized protein n=1 Tax=Mycena alexandri TaxID=1745969 RepID=A0AAD6S861_9AGAR|nr:hypothetical protein C8F04DRAFT_1194943 [Mycena alexandri]